MMVVIYLYMYFVMFSNTSNQFSRSLDTSGGSYSPVQSNTNYPELGFLGGAMVKNMSVNAGDARDRVRSLGPDDPLEEGMATHPSILAWRIPWTEEPGGL